MSKITHDLRPPLVVVAGKFNPAIFSSYWIASELFGIGDGQEMHVTETTIELPNGIQITLTFLEGVGINFADDKIQISLVDFSDETVERARSVLRNIFEKLPHTPIGAIGVNFRWFDDDPTQKVIDFFDTAEGLEAAYEILERTHKTKIREEEFTLNLSRHFVKGEAVFDFNYHRRVINTSAVVNLLNESFISSEFAHAKALLEKFYEYKEFQTLTFKDDAEEIEGEEDAEIDKIEGAETA